MPRLRTISTKSIPRNQSRLRFLLLLWTILSTTVVVNAEIYTIFGVDRDIDIHPEDFPSNVELAALEAAMPPMDHGWIDSVVDRSPGTPAQLHYRTWLPASGSNDTSPRAAVIYTHGIQSHSGKSHVFSSPDKDTVDRPINTALLASSLLEHHIALYALDLYGHGYSEGDRFFIPESYQTNVDDLLQLVRLVAQEQPTDVPILLMGDSYGGTLSLHAAAYFLSVLEQPPEANPKDDTVVAARIDSLVLTSPALDIDTPATPVLQILTGLAVLFPRWTPFFMPNPVSPDRIWRDPQVWALRTDPTQAGNRLDGSGLKLRLGTAVAVLDAVDDLRTKVIPRFTLPFVTLHGTADEAVFPEGSEFLVTTAATPENDKLYIPVVGAYHDLLAEPDNVAEECVQEILDWIQMRIGPVR